MIPKRVLIEIFKDILPESLNVATANAGQTRLLGWLE
jgi:hypothetical protein